MRRILDAKAEVEEDDAAEGAIVPYMKLTKLILILALENDVRLYSASDCA